MKDKIKTEQLKGKSNGRVILCASYSRFTWTDLLRQGNVDFVASLYLYLISFLLIKHLSSFLFF